MRLWHKDLIPVLPNQQLLGQWRECCAIARNIAIKGTSNHLLVNRVMNYSPRHLLLYTLAVCDELESRGFKINRNRFYQWLDEWLGEWEGKLHVVSWQDLFADWHNDRYLTQCFYNLQEKRDCGGMTKEEYKLLLQFDIDRRVYK